MVHKQKRNKLYRTKGSKKKKKYKQRPSVLGYVWRKVPYTVPIKINKIKETDVVYHNELFESFDDVIVL